MTAARLTLSGRNGAGHFALVDEVDYERVTQYRWWRICLGNSEYAFTVMSGRQKVWLHRFVLGAERGGPEIDHIDLDGLNCQRSNLRFASNSQNHVNQPKTNRPTSSKYKGVTLKPSGRWLAQIMVMKRNRVLGRFDSEEDAARAYDAAAREVWGDYARTNFPKIGD